MPKKLTINDFILKASTKHFVKWDYSKSVYVNNSTKIEIGCKKHGWFWQTPMDHLVGKGCKKCANENRTFSQKDFEKNANEKHNSIYEYPFEDYINSYSKIRIKCSKHGIFKQEAYSHLRGQGCPKCKSDKNSIRQFRNGDDVLKEMNIKHNFKYKYPDYNYKGVRFKIQIECTEHGIFNQKVGQHLLGRGCPKCSNYVSNPELELHEFIRSLKINIETSDKKNIYPYELDIYIPELKKAIEFNGNWWHYNHSNPKCKPKGYHSMKSKLCRDKNIRLLHVREDLWNRDKQKMKEIILKFLE